MVEGMGEGTLKTPVPKCSLYWSFLFGVVKQFCSVNTVRLVWEVGGKVREKVEGQQYTSIVPSSMHRKKKLFDIPVFSWDNSYQTIPRRE